MLEIGFANSFVDLISRCIGSVNYLVCLNGERGEQFKPMKGDPLRPYLFLISSEGISSLMRLALREGTIKGARVCQKGLVLTHILFADDCILFGNATERGAQNLKAILREYEICSAQCINFEKSIAYFSTNVRKQRLEQMGNILKVRTLSNLEKYLGLPNMVGRDKKRTFQIVKDHMISKINGWSIKHLSHGRKEVFIKSVLQVIPTYSMACFFVTEVFLFGIGKYYGEILVAEES
ncbi:reverse transcriptase [Gossypium australe]|uniref:Reverse transcriptase n=1 Tax=Gossypium australe TaxID=47621 RepID=A0A5B6U6P4_9ROSI|nr:reverse transcriptase [Gossypium australe]